METGWTDPVWTHSPVFVLPFIYPENKSANQGAPVAKQISFDFSFIKDRKVPATCHCTWGILEFEITWNHWNHCRTCRPGYLQGPRWVFRLHIFTESLPALRWRSQATWQNALAAWLVIRKLLGCLARSVGTKCLGLGTIRNIQLVSTFASLMTPQSFWQSGSSSTHAGFCRRGQSFP